MEALETLSWTVGLDWEAVRTNPDYRAAKVQLLTMRALRSIEMTDEVASAVEAVLARVAEQLVSPDPV